MKTLSQTFKEHQVSHLNHQTKASIYSKFLTKKQRKYTSRRSLVYKPLVYTISTLSVIGFLLLSNFFGVFDYNLKEINQTVVAQTIGQIINHEWDIAIYNKDNRPIAADTIQLNDRIVVGDKSTVTVLVHDSFTAEITGPAQFEIIIDEKNESVDYKLSFIQGGDFIAINGLKEDNNNISIQTSDGVTLQKEQSSWQRMAFSIQQQPHTQTKTITNRSSDQLSFSIGDTNSSSQITIDAENIIDIKTNEQNNEKTITILAQKPISIEEETTTISKPIITTIPSPSYTKQTKDEIVFNDTQYTTLHSYLYSVFLTNNINDLIKTYTQGDDKQHHVTLLNINNRLNRIWELINHTPNNTITLPAIITHAWDILTWYRTHNTIRPSSYRNLSRFVRAIESINTIEYSILENNKSIETIDDIYRLLPQLERPSFF